MTGTTMMRSLLLCLALTACNDAKSAAEEPPATDEAASKRLELPEHLATRVDDYVGQWGRGWPAFRVHGEIAVSVGGEVGMQRSYGFRDLLEQEEHEGGARFRIGTLSAHVTAATAVALAREGLLDVEARVDRYLPNAGVPDVMTVEHLLTHTSGLPSFTEDMAWKHIKHIDRRHSDIVAGFVRDPLEFEPGTEFAPSNSNSALLGLVIEAATGMPYQDAARKHLLGPLSMDETIYGDGVEIPVAQGLVFAEAEHLEPPHLVEPRAFGAAGGWTSTTRDVHRLYAGLWSKPERARLRWFGDNAYEHPYALVGASVGGKEAFLWLGRIDGFNSAALLVPEDELVVTVLANTEVVPAQHVAMDVASLVYGLDIAERVEPRDVPVPSTDLEPVAGNWVITRKTETMLLDAVSPETFDKLRRITTRYDEDKLTVLIPGHGRKRMHPLGKNRFFFKDGPQSTGAFRPGPTPDKDILVLARGGTELRYLRAPVTIAAKP